MSTYKKSKLCYMIVYISIPLMFISVYIYWLAPYLITILMMFCLSLTRCPSCRKVAVFQFKRKISIFGNTRFTPSKKCEYCGFDFTEK